MGKVATQPLPLGGSPPLLSNPNRVFVQLTPHTLIEQSSMPGGNLRFHSSLVDYKWRVTDAVSLAECFWDSKRCNMMDIIYTNG